MRWQVFFWGTTVGLMTHQLSQLVPLHSALTVLIILPLGVAVVVDQVTEHRKFWNGVLGGAGAMLGTAMLLALVGLAFGPAEPIALPDMLAFLGLALCMAILCGGITALIARLRKRPIRRALGSH